jgi:uncharacterized spore protein YtfJ
LTTGADNEDSKRLSGAMENVSADAIIGRPIEVGPVKVVPVASCWFGSLGTGGQGGSEGAGFAAAVASVRPAALIVIDGRDVAVFSLRPSGVVEGLKEVADQLGEAFRVTNSDQVAGRVSGAPEAPSNPT